MPRPTRSTRRTATGAATVLGLAASLGLGAAGLTAPMASASDPTAPVQTGTHAGKVPGAVPFGDTDPSTPESVTFVLQMRGQQSLANQVTSGMTNFVSVDQFAARYGQNDNQIARLVSYLESFGLKTTVFADKIAIHATGTADQFNKALQTTQQNWKIPAKGNRPASIAHSPKGAPQLPGSLAHMVTAILGLDNYAPFTTSAKAADASRIAAPGATQAATCPLKARPEACHLPSDFASRYGVTPLYQQGATGKGRTIGIVTLAALDQGAPEHFWSTWANVPSTGRTVTVQDIDGGPGAPNDKAGTGETDLDVEQSGGVAPGANVVVYQAPNSDAGWADAFLTAASQNTADSVSSSWGYSETVTRYGVAAGWETPALQAAYDEVFLELAAQGQSTFLSSADQGAYVASNDLGTTDLSVDAPANSPYVTSAGGTTTPWSGTFHSRDGKVTAHVEVTAERAWGWDYLWAPIAAVDGIDYATAAKENIEGGGGGYSVLEARPSYQQAIPGIGNYSAVQYLTPTNYVTDSGLTLPTDWDVNPNPPLVHGSASGRVEPDVSADADPYSGYLMYEPSAGAGSELQAGWGGTSFVAPQFNGATAVMAESLGRRVGLWNPAMYRLALTKDSPVTPINIQGTESDNLFYTGTPGTLFNPAVGLGTPNLAKFTSQLAAGR